MPTWSIVIPWCNRDGLDVTLARNHELLARHDAEIVVVNGGGSAERLRAQIAGAPRPARVIDLPDAVFSRSLCLNVGALMSRGSFLFLVDADIVLASDILSESLAYLRSGSCFVAVQRIVESEPAVFMQGETATLTFLAEMVDTRELLSVDGRRAVLRGRMSPNGTRAGNGLVLVKRDDLIAVGGLNSHLAGWGYEDTDFQIRLQFALGLVREEAGRVIHLTHGPASDRDIASRNRNMQACTQNYSRGDYVGSFELDAATWRERLVEWPIATQAADRFA